MVEVDHALDGLTRAAGDSRVDGDLLFEEHERLSRIFGSVMRFICGQRLHGRTNSTSGASTATLSLIEHSVTSSTLRRLLVLDPFDHAGGRAGEVGLGDHVGRAFRMGDDLMPGSASR